MGIEWALILFKLKSIGRFCKEHWKILVLIAMVFVSFGAGWKVAHDDGVQKIAAIEKSIADKKQVVEVGQAKVDTKIITEYVPKIERIYLEAKNNKYIIENNVKPSPNLPEGWVYMHNLSILGGGGDPELAGNPTDSGISPKQALGTITDNNATCRAEIEKLNALQNWITLSKKNVDDANKGKK